MSPYNTSAITISIERPTCPICGKEPLLIASAGHQYYECTNPNCAVTGFRVDCYDKELVSIWLGKNSEYLAVQTSGKREDLHSEKAFINKLDEWDKYLKLFLRRKEKTAYEQRAIKKLKGWSSRYSEGYSQ